MDALFILLQRALPHHLLSRLVGFAANTRIRFIKNLGIRWFCSHYPVNVSEAVSSQYDDYETFNAFFTRALREGIRPVSGAVSSPADGTVAECGRLSADRLIQAKGHTFTLTELLGRGDCEPLHNGSFMTVYLAPHDYHRVHAPYAGQLVSARYIPGKLFSVNQTTAERIPGLYALNERLVMHFDTDRGPMIVVMVGAMIVAGIRTVWHDKPYQPGHRILEKFEPPRRFEQGDELGWFEMGSTAIVVLPGDIDWQHEAGDVIRMGAPIA